MRGGPGTQLPCPPLLNALSQVGLPRVRHQHHQLSRVLLVLLRSLLLEKRSTFRGSLRTPEEGPQKLHDSFLGYALVF